MKQPFLKIRNGLTKMKILVYLILEENPGKNKKYLVRIKKIIEELEMDIRKIELRR